MKKIIIFAILMSVLAVALIVPTAAVSALPSYPADSTSQYIGIPLPKEDVLTLANGLYAQFQLEVLISRIDNFFYVTMTNAGNNLYYYTAYVSYPDRVSTGITISFIGSAGTAGVFDLGMYVAASKSTPGIFRPIDLSLTGGMLIKGGDSNYYYKSNISENAYKLADNEIVVAYFDPSSGTMITPAPDAYYSQTLTDPDGQTLAKLTAMRDMANSWIAARDAKAGKTTSSGGTYSEGYDAGYDEGKADGYDEGKTDGYNDGKAEGYDEGLEAGNTSGYQSGYAAGSADGYDRGYEKGDKAGYDRGYSEGTLKADQGAQIDIAAIVTAVPVGVKNFISNSFGFELFGINIAGLLFTLIAVALTVFVVKRFKG